MEPILLDKKSTGVPGLDAILGGGFPSEEVILIQGAPGTGKTTLALQFLRAGVEAGEVVLFVTLSQTARTLENIAHSHGWSLDGVAIREFGQDADTAAEGQTVFPSYEVELDETVQAIRNAVEEVRPARAVVDALVDLRVLSGQAVRFRRELLELRRFFHRQACTALFLDAENGEVDTSEMESQAHGVIRLHQTAPEYGDVRRRLQVSKMRGTPFLGGNHNFRIRTGGVQVFPRVKANGKNGHAAWEALGSGIPELDQMLGGGLREGTACLIVGPAGSGKTALAYQHAYHAARQGMSAAVFLFDERLETFYMRARGMGMDAVPLVEAGRLLVRQINTGTITPSEFAQTVRGAVEEGGAKVVVVDSLAGYFHAMLQRRLLVTQLHELLTYLSQEGVLSILVVSQDGRPVAMDGGGVEPTQVSYLADTVLLLRYRERDGYLDRTLSILKQRHAWHDRSARSFEITPRGIEMGGAAAGYVGLTLDPPLITAFYEVNGHDGKTHAVDDGR